MNNFNGVMAVVAALQCAGIFRLRKTWSQLPSSHREILDDLRKVTSREGNFREFRKLWKTVTPPVIPYFGK